MPSSLPKPIEEKEWVLMRVRVLFHLRRAAVGAGSPISYLSLTFVSRFTPKRPGRKAGFGGQPTEPGDQGGGNQRALSLQGTAASFKLISVGSICRTCPPVSAIAPPRTPGRRPAACGVSWWSPSCWQASGQCPFSRLGSPTWMTSRSPTTRPCTSVSHRLEEGRREEGWVLT